MELQVESNKKSIDCHKKDMETGRVRIATAVRTTDCCWVSRRSKLLS